VDDGGTSTAQNPTHVYIAAGSFLPSLTAHSTYGPAAWFTISGQNAVTNPSSGKQLFYRLIK
jgi:PKD repeat protein